MSTQTKIGPIMKEYLSFEIALGDNYVYSKYSPSIIYKVIDVDVETTQKAIDEQSQYTDFVKWEECLYVKLERMCAKRYYKSTTFRLATSTAHKEHTNPICNLVFIDKDKALKDLISEAKRWEKRQRDEQSREQDKDNWTATQRKHDFKYRR